jgi:hypothetical protein
VFVAFFAHPKRNALMMQKWTIFLFACKQRRMTCVIVQHGHFSGEHQVENICPILCVFLIESSLVQKTKALFRAAELRANHVLRKVQWIMRITCVI